MNIFRSIFFNLSFYVFTLVYATVFMLPFVLFKTDKQLRKSIYIYCWGSLFLARWVMGIKQTFRGHEKLPAEGSYILAAAHQSYMDPMMAYIIRQDVTALAKKELFSTPVIGSLLKKCRIIRIDRESGKAHNMMEGVVDQANKLGRPIIIYPQATRVKPGRYVALKSGAYFLQKSGDLPVYTVATTTGAFWTKGFWHRSGHAIFDVIRLVPAGLSKADFMDILEKDIVEKSDTLFKEVGFDVDQQKLITIKTAPPQ